LVIKENIMTHKKIGRSVVVATAMFMLSIVAMGCLGGTDDDVVAELRADRTALTQQQCEERGGGVVGDIGDGATHQADYVCPGGKPPLGDIEPAAQDPIAVEGSICCLGAAS
jgi:hypothetical protein